MRLHIAAAASLVVFATCGSALAQFPESVTAHVNGWDDGEAQVILFNANDWPPPMELPPDAMVVGSVTADGELTFTLPATVPEEGFVPVGPFLDPGCQDLAATPEDAAVYPIELLAYSNDGPLIGMVFQANPGATGPVPGGYSVTMGYAAEGYSLRGSCPQTGRNVVEEYDFTVEPGWHSLLQRFTEHPEEAGVRVDSWVNEAIPEDAAWLIERPPQ